MLNVLGGSLVNKPFILPNGTRGYEFGFDRYFTELARILQPDGKLFIGEFLPRVREVEWLKDEYNYNLFGLSKQVFEGNALEIFTSRYGIPLSTITGWDRRYPPFFIALTKTTPAE